MIAERPLLRRRLKAAWRLGLQAWFKIPCKGVFGLPWTLLRHLPRDRALCVVDVGAHDGDFTGGLSAWCGVERVILAEPLPDKVGLLRRRFPGPAAFLHAGALADRSGTAEFKLNTAATATSSLLRARRDLADMDHLGEEQTLTVNLRRLDDVAAEAGMPRVDLLKIDVQGAEDAVLRGATETLRRTRLAWIECSFLPLYERSAIFADVQALMEAANFGLLDWNEAMRGKNGELIQIDALFRRRDS
jgi:FkbM family methyltransferase